MCPLQPQHMDHVGRDLHQYATFNNQKLLKSRSYPKLFSIPHHFYLYHIIFCSSPGIEPISMSSQNKRNCKFRMNNLFIDATHSTFIKFTNGKHIIKSWGQKEQMQI